MTGQTKKGSALEALAGTAIGFAISWAATPPILWAFGYDVGAGTAFGITVVYTVLSIVRGYVVRRVFNRLQHRHAPWPKSDPPLTTPERIAIMRKWRDRSPEQDEAARELSESADILKNWSNPAVQEAVADWNRRRLEDRGHLPARDCDP